MLTKATAHKKTAYDRMLTKATSRCSCWYRMIVLSTLRCYSRDLSLQRLYPFTNSKQAADPVFGTLCTSSHYCAEQSLGTAVGFRFSVCPVAFHDFIQGHYSMWRIPFVTSCRLGHHNLAGSHRLALWHSGVKLHGTAQGKKWPHTGNTGQFMHLQSLFCDTRQPAV